MEVKHWLIVYDIRDTKRLVKVSKCMESYAWRIQNSVFESSATAETIGRLKRELERIIDAQQDFILFFEICERDFQKKEKFGKMSNQNKIIDEAYAIL